MKRKFNWLDWLSLFFVGGCGLAPKGTGSVFKFAEPAAGMANIYHYRLEKSSSSSRFYYLFLNREFVSVIGNGGFSGQRMVPGEGEFSITSEIRMPGGSLAAALDKARGKARSVYQFKVLPDRCYYFRWSCAFGDELIESVEETVALQELKGLKEFQIKA